MKAPLIFYWPTTLMMVDDSLSFMEAVSFQLAEKKLRSIYSNPKQALKILQSNVALVDKISCLAKPLILHELDEKIAAKKLDYQGLVELIYEIRRFSVISTVLVDYEMPEMNGLDFCREIKNFPVKKIMLTGKIGNDLAVAAFNEGIIDGFMDKSIDSIRKKLNNFVLKMKQQYFSDIALNLIGKPVVELQQNQDYLRIFWDFLHDHHIKEYYQVDQYGSYLGLDSAGCTHWLMVRTEENFDAALDVMKYSDDQNSFAQSLKEKSHLLFLFSEIEKKLSASSWRRFLFPITKSFQVNGKLHYCAIVSGEIFSLIEKKITHLKSYNARMI